MLTFNNFYSIIITIIVITIKYFKITEEKNMAHTCRNCGGSGKATCPRCGGSGKFSSGETCYYCQGEGKVECKACDGRGMIED